MMKLVTTYAALDLLGPAYTWTTPVYLNGTVDDGMLDGNLYIKGQGDPKLVIERLWLLLRRVQELGIREIAATSCSTAAPSRLPTPTPAAFDGEPLRPYNAAPDALLLNFKSVVMHLHARPAARRRGVSVEPAAGRRACTTPRVPLSAAPAATGAAR